MTGEENFAARVEALIGEITAASPLILRLNNRAVRHHLGQGFAQALGGVSELFLGTLMKTEDTLEGIASYDERGKPFWKNR